MRYDNESGGGRNDGGLGIRVDLVMMTEVVIVRVDVVVVTVEEVCYERWWSWVEVI